MSFNFLNYYCLFIHYLFIYFLLSVCKVIYFKKKSNTPSISKFFSQTGLGEHKST